MAYKRKGYKAHDNMKVLPKDLSGKSSTNQRTPQIKPGRSPGKLRMSNPNTGIDEVYNANSNISTGMGNLASNATNSIYQNQNNTGFTNNPMLSSKAGNVNQSGGYGDFYGGGGNTVKRKEGTFNSKAAMEAATDRRTSSSGITRDLSENATKGTGSIQDMINSTVSSVQASQDTKRAAGLKKYKSDASAAEAKRQAENDARFDQYKSSSQSKYNKLKGSYDKMTAAQKAQAAAAKIRRSKPKNVVKKVAKSVTKVVKGVTKGVSKVTKSISRGIRRLFGGRRRRRRKSPPKKTTPKKTTTNKVSKGLGFFNTPGRTTTISKKQEQDSYKKKATVKKKVTPKKRRRRKRRRWFSDMRLKQNILLIGSSKSGIPIYNFSYTGDNTIYQGAMAQDLISMGYDSAVTTDNKSGYYMVDYSQIDVDMITI